MSDDKKNTGFKRKFHLKSRKGCSTCKKRRVKCDEAKPLCNNCVRMKLVCGYLDDAGDHGPSSKRQKAHVKSEDDLLVSSPDMQQATPGKTPSPHGKQDSATPSLIASALSSGLLNAGNLNNINLSHLVNNLSNIGDLSGLGNLANLSSLAVLAQLPIDLSALGPQMAGMGLSLPGFGGLSGLDGHPSAVEPPENVLGNHISVNTSQPNLGLQNVRADDLHEDVSDDPPVVLPEPYQEPPSISPNVSNMPNPLALGGLGNSGTSPFFNQGSSGLNMLDLRLMYHYTTQVASTITGAGISDTDIWNHDVPMLAFEYPFLMHAILAFSATHLSRTEKGLDQCVTCHRGDALRLLREAILDINSDNTDALVASALILIMDSLANASVPSLTSPKSLPASAWIFHVKGAATILTAVWPLTEASRFYKFISVDLGDLGDIINEKSQLSSMEPHSYANLECHDSDIADLYPVPINSPYLITLAYLNKLHKERYKADFILRIFAFPALLDKDFLTLLMSGDIKAMRIMRSYYKLLRSFTTEMKDKVWFLEGVSQVLPVDVEEYAGGAGGMHMMLDFLGGGPAIVEDHEVDKDLSMIDPGGQIANKLIDTNNLPSDITSNLDIMQGDNGIMGIK